MRSLPPVAPAAGKEASRAERVLPLTRLYERLLLGLAALLPLLAIAYLHAFLADAPPLHEHAFHEVAIAVAIGQSLFVAFVAWRCYLHSGEPLLRWLTLAFVGFALVYAPHGVFTRLGDHHMVLFLLYGPLSRLAMNACVLVGMLAFGAAAHDSAQRQSLRRWSCWGVGFLLLDVGIAALALWAPAWGSGVRLVAETGALGLALAAALSIRMRGLRSPLMRMSAVAVLYFAQSSLAFLLALPWSHLWWLAHFISACGFALLSYGVVRAFHTTRAFSLVFSQEEVMVQLSAAKAGAEAVAAQLRQANADLATLAATDSLTGLYNRRHFLDRCGEEMARARRAGEPFVVLALDIDHFKRINDGHGHATGDAVLTTFARTLSMQLRPSDLVGRWGGEEFMVLLPSLAGPAGLAVAERVRQAVGDCRVPSRGGEGAVRMTVSVGVAAFPADGEELEALFRVADRRLYGAKAAGRDRVCADDPAVDAGSPAPAGLSVP